MKAPQQLSSPSGATKRPRNYEEWVRNKAKKARNHGQEYLYSCREMVAAKKVGQPCTCNRKCFETIGVDTINAIHAEYWSADDHNARTAFIQNHSIEAPVKRCRVSDEDRQRPRSNIFVYQLKAGDQLVTVCKKGFCRYPRRN